MASSAHRFRAPFHGSGGPRTADEYPVVCQIPPELCSTGLPVVDPLRRSRLFTFERPIKPQPNDLFMDEPAAGHGGVMRARSACLSVVMISGALAHSAVARPSVRPLLDAIREVESGGRTGVILGDEGRSLGPYQIQRPYWQDSGIPGRYTDVSDPGYAERVMLGYWKRYCPKALDRGDWATLARVHNGGPTGHRKAATLKYWRKVQQAMRSR